MSLLNAPIGLFPGKSHMHGHRGSNKYHFRHITDSPIYLTPIPTITPPIPRSPSASILGHFPYTTPNFWLCLSKYGAITFVDHLLDGMNNDDTLFGQTKYFGRERCSSLLLIPSHRYTRQFHIIKENP